MDARFVNALRERGVALVLIDQSWVPRPWELKESLDFVTSNFAYVRLLGNREGIEEMTKMWDKVIVNRIRDMRSWVLSAPDRASRRYDLCLRQQPLRRFRTDDGRKFPRTMEHVTKPSCRELEASVDLDVLRARL